MQPQRPQRLPRRVLVVDDDRVFHEYLTSLCHDAGFHVCGHALTAEHGVLLSRELEPDLILLDLRLPYFSSGLEVAATLRADQLPAQIVLFSSIAPEAVIRSMARYQLDGYLTKTIPANALLRHLRAISQGACIWTTDTAPYVVPEWERLLSPRAISTLRCIAHGCTIEECAEILGGTPNAHRKRRERIQTTLGRSGRQLIAYCREKGFDLLPLDRSPFAG